MRFSKHILHCGCVLTILAASAVPFPTAASPTGAAAAQAEEAAPSSLSPRAVLERATHAAGGEVWANPTSLRLSGYGLFYQDGTQENVVRADDYRMLRVYGVEREAAHGPDGLVRIDAFSNGQVMFQMAFDGKDTWTQNGRMDDDRAKETWANAFGFGIIRHALRDGFALKRLPDDLVDGQSVYMVQITDPAGQLTHFGVSMADYRILKVGFDTPRGWHERIYSDFYWVDQPGWLQPGRVRLYYNGVKSNEIFWRRAEVNVEIDRSAFTLGQGAPR